MLVGVLVFFLCVLAFVVLAQYLNHRSSEQLWQSIHKELNEMLDGVRDRLRLEKEANWGLREELRRATQTLKFRSPDVACTMEVRQLFEHFGGPERTAAIIAENYAKLEARYRELKGKNDCAEYAIAALDRRYEQTQRWMRQAHRRQKNFRRLWKRYRDETRSLREEERLVRSFYEDVAEV